MDNRAKLALAATFGWIVGAASLAGMNWEAFNELKLNEAGDFLAGAFAPLAFLWLIVGYFQQGDELKQNTEALRLQAEELQHAVAEYKQLNETNERNANLLQRQYDDAKSDAAAKLKPNLLVADVQPEGNDGHSQHYRIRLLNHGAPAAQLKSTVISIIAEVNSTTYAVDTGQKYEMIFKIANHVPIGMYEGYLRTQCVTVDHQIDITLFHLALDKTQQPPALTVTRTPKRDKESEEDYA